MSNTSLSDYIVQAALARGIDPKVALKVANGEGGVKNPFRRGEGPAPRSQARGFGHLENSFGPFQLYISGTGAGLGDRAVAAGIDPRKNWQGGIDFALDEAKRAGWGQWYGAKAVGITGKMGIGGVPSAGPTPAPAASLAAAYDPAGAGNPASGPPQALGDVVAPSPVMPVAEAPGIGTAIATFLQSRQDRDKAAAEDRARREALFGGLGNLYAPT